MAQKKYWIGTTGPFIYDDTQVYSDGPSVVALRTEGAITGGGGGVITGTPTSGNVAVADGTKWNSSTPDAAGLVAKSGAQTGIAGAKTFSNKMTLSDEIEIDGALNHDGTTVGVFAVAPVTRQTALTSPLTTITHSGPGTPDYAIATPVMVVPWGFTTQDEFETVMSVIRNLQIRVNELETKLQAYGWLQ